MKAHKKRVLYVEQADVGTTGGSHVSLLELIKALNGYEYELLVMFYEENRLLEEFREIADKVMVYKKPRMLNIRDRLPALRLPLMAPFGIVLTAFQKAFNLIAAIHTICGFVGFLRRERIDLVHLNNAFHIGFDWLIASRLCGAKCITHQRGLDAVPRTAKFYIRLYDRIICVSEHIRDALRMHGLPVAEKACVIYNGLDMGAFAGKIGRNPSIVKRELGFEHDEPVIGVVGNIKPWKGQRVVVDAVFLLKREYSRVRCLLIGSPLEGPAYFQSLKNRVAEKRMGKNVFFVGFRKDVSDFMNTVDILIHSSIKPEPFGRVILEGMALGKPVIATNIGGPAEIIENNVSGLLVRPSDPQAMAERISYLLKHKGVRQRLGRMAVQRVKEKFDINLIAGQVDEVYKSLLANGADDVCLKR